MTGILPNVAAGGVVVQDGAGNPTIPVNVNNIYVPPAPFTFSCDQTGLPSDCTAVIQAEQINALMSELICLAQAFDPDGEWTCSDVCNTGTAITAFLTGTGPGTLTAALNALGLADTFTTLVDAGGGIFTWTSADGASTLNLNTKPYTASAPLAIDASRNITLSIAGLSVLLP